MLFFKDTLSLLKIEGIYGMLTYFVSVKLNLSNNNTFTYNVYKIE